MKLGCRSKVDTSLLVELKEEEFNIKVGTGPRGDQEVNQELGKKGCVRLIALHQAVGQRFESNQLWAVRLDKQEAQSWSEN